MVRSSHNRCLDEDDAVIDKLEKKLIRSQVVYETKLKLNQYRPGERVANVAIRAKTVTLKAPTTSRENNMHKKSFDCIYPEASIQIKVDEIIDRILQGDGSHQIVADILTLIDEGTASTVILGCTELSLFAKELSVSNKKILDPLEILAKKILERSFENKSCKC